MPMRKMTYDCTATQVVTPDPVSLGVKMELLFRTTVHLLYFKFQIYNKEMLVIIPAPRKTELGLCLTAW